MVFNLAIEGPKPKCIRCRSTQDIRRVSIERGYNPDLIHYVCDYCEIGWYELPGKRAVRLSGDFSTAQRAYTREGRPPKLESGRKK